MAKQISSHSQIALDQYLALLHNLGADDSNLLRRKTFIMAFVHELEKIPHNDQVYGSMVDDKLSMFTQPELKHFYQVTAREYFWFWAEDEAKIDAMFRGELISVNPFTIVVKESLEHLQSKAQSYFEQVPNNSLNKYEEHLAGSTDSALRIRWAQTLLYTFKDFVQEDFAYRAATDTILNMMESRTMKQSFLVVVRDFHSFWKSNR